MELEIQNQVDVELKLLKKRQKKKEKINLTSLLISSDFKQDSNHLIFILSIKLSYASLLFLFFSFHSNPPTLMTNTQLFLPNFHLKKKKTPGWSAPWAPFHRSYTTSQPPTHFHFSSDLPLPSQSSALEHFLLENIFAPLFFRFFNLAANSCSLGLASHMRMQEMKAGLPGVMGSSTLLTVVVSPLAIVHIFVTLYVSV